MSEQVEEKLGDEQTRVAAVHHYADADGRYLGWFEDIEIVQRVTAGEAEGEERVARVEPHDPPVGGVATDGPPHNPVYRWDADVGGWRPAEPVYAVDADGRYLGGFEPDLLPAGAAVVDAPPGDATDTWDGTAWTPNLSVRRKAAKTAIDRAAEDARLAFITNGAGQAMVYERKAQEAEKALDDPTPEAAVYPLLAAEVGVTAPETGDEAADLQAVAAIVIARRDAWLTIAGQIEAARLTAKAAVDQAADAAEVEAIVAGLSWPAPQ